MNNQETSKTVDLYVFINQSISSTLESFLSQGKLVNKTTCLEYGSHAVLGLRVSLRFFTLCRYEVEGDVSIHNLWSFSIFTARKGSLRRLCVHRCLSVHRGCLPIACWDTPPQADTAPPPWTDTPPGQTPAQCMLGYGQQAAVCIPLECILVNVTFILRQGI